MLKNNSLGDKLNEYRKNESLINESESEPDSRIPQGASILEGLNLIFSSIYYVLRILIYGFSTKIIFNAPWNFWQVMCLGIGINFLMSYIYNLVHGKQ